MVAQPHPSGAEAFEVQFAELGDAADDPLERRAGELLL